MCLRDLSTDGPEGRLVRQPAVTVPDPDAVKAAIADGSGFIALPRRPRAEEPAPDTPVLLHAPTARPSDTRFPTQRHGTSGNPHVALVRDHLFQAARDW